MQKTCSIGHKDTGVFLENERKTKIVTFITLITMIAEIIMGYWSGSMALLADGWHMASHAIALSLTLIVYYLYRHAKFRSAFTFGGGKILSLGGYTSALFLVFIACSMIYESLLRFHHLPQIHYQEALIVAVLGLVINLICVSILHKGSHSHGHDHHHHKDHHHSCKHEHDHHHHQDHDHAKDHNHNSAYAHIMADAFTSILAIIALALGQWKGWSWLDPAVGILGGIVVFKWSLGIISETGKDLLDAHDPSINKEKLIHSLERDGSQVVDLHLWKLAPHKVGCELVIRSNSSQKSADYRDIIQKDFQIHHLIIEVV
jgi:cation diffusion facilitator family transporter